MIQSSKIKRKGINWEKLIDFVNRVYYDLELSHINPDDLTYILIRIANELKSEISANRMRRINEKVYSKSRTSIHDYP